MLPPPILGAVEVKRLSCYGTQQVIKDALTIPQGTFWKCLISIQPYSYKKKTRYCVLLFGSQPVSG